MKGKKRTESIVNVELYRRWGGAQVPGRSAVKKLVSVLLIVFVSGLALHAETSLRWSWYTQNEEISFFRYQEGGEEDDGWTVVDSSVTSVILPLTESSALYVQASTDGINWSPSGYASYTPSESSEATETAENSLPVTEPAEDTAPAAPESAELTSEPSAAEETVLSDGEEKHNSLRVGITPYSIAFYRFYNGYNTTSTRTKTNSVYGFSSSVEFNMPLSSWLSIYPELSCDIIVKKDTIIPGARNVYYIKAGIGFDYTHTFNTRYTLYTGLFGGAIAHINNSKASITPYFGARLGFEYALGEHFSLGAVSRVSLALFSARSEQLMDSLTILVNPVSVTLTYRF